MTAQGTIELDPEFAAVLNQAASTATFHLYPDLSFSAHEFKAIYKVGSNADYPYGVTAIPEIHRDEGSRLAQYVRSAFASYIENDHIGVAATLDVSDTPVISVEDFTKILVRSAVALGIERLTNLIADWLKGESPSYEAHTIFAGLSPQGSVNMSNKVRLRPIPTESGGIDPDLPSRVKRLFGATELSSLVHMTVVSVDRALDQVRPLYRPSDAEGQNSELLRASRDEFLHIIALKQALSLAFNAPIVPIVDWRDYGDLLPFNSGELGATLFPSRQNHEVFSTFTLLYSHVDVGADQLALAERLIEKLSAENTSRLGLYLPITKWLGSKLRRQRFEDRLVDLRTALESLFLSDGEDGEITYRLSVRAALRLAEDVQTRRQYLRDMKSFYGLASRAVHGRSVKIDDKYGRLLTFAQDVCRKEIFRRLEDGKRPNWDDITLGINT